MRMNKLGRTGLFVSELCLGTMTFGGEEGMWGQIGRLQQDEADRLVGAAIEGGINFVDTADVYADGRSEEITGQALKNLKIARDAVVIATKVYGPMGPGANTLPRRGWVTPSCRWAMPPRPWSFTKRG